MTSYFDEHNCEPLGQNESPNGQLMLARLLLDSGVATALGMDFASLSAANNMADLPPATSARWLRDEMPKHCFDEAHKSGYECPICLLKFDANSKEAKNACKLPDCGHSFHFACLLKWLENTSNCPMCRHDLPTDNADYEEFKLQKKRAANRQRELDALHDSMFS